MKPLFTLVIAMTAIFTMESKASAQPIELNIKCTYVETIDSLNFVRVIVTDKHSEAGVPVPDVLCNLFLSEVSLWGMQGSLITDKNGSIEFPLVNKFRIEDQKLNEYVFILRVANDDRFVAVNDTTVFQKAELDIEYGEDKSISVYYFSTDKEKIDYPISNSTVKVFLQTAKGLKELKQFRTKTDVNGRAMILFEGEYQAYSGNYLELLTRVESEEYGHYEATSFQEWGLNQKQWKKQLSSNQTRNKRTALFIGLGALLSFLGIRGWNYYKSQY